MNEGDSNSCIDYSEWIMYSRLGVGLYDTFDICKPPRDENTAISMDLGFICPYLNVFGF